VAQRRAGALGGAGDGDITAGVATLLEFSEASQGVAVPRVPAFKEELIYGQQRAADEEGKVLVWTGGTDSITALASHTAFFPATAPQRAPLSYTPTYLTEKILDARHRLEGERKQVTILFADIKDSTDLIRDLDPEAAQQLLDPALRRMMDAVHGYEGTVNQVLGDGIMALFSAPIAHEDHALRACYASLAMQVAMREYTEEVCRAHGLELRIRVGLNAGEVVVREIGNDLDMDYSARSDAAAATHTHHAQACAAARKSGAAAAGL
jgi:class 3 adenylate cyclase